MQTESISRDAQDTPAIEVMPRPEGGSDDIPRLNRPIFISGLRKSGTSMTKELFDGHPDLYVIPPNELHVFRFTEQPSVVKDKASWETDLNVVKKLVCEQKYVHRLRESNHFLKFVNIETFDRLVAEQTPRTVADVFAIVMTAMAKASSHVTRDVSELRFVSKTVLETEYVPDLVKWFPDMKFIYVLRNPYGHFNAARWSLRSRGLINPRDKGFHWRKHPYPYLGPEIHRMKLSYYFMRRWRQLYPENFYVLVYDDLVQNPEVEMRKMCDFLDLEYNDCLLRTTNCGKERTKKGWTVEKPREDASIDPGPATKWKAQISPLEVRLINEYFGDVIKEFGFEKLPSRASIFRMMDISERPGNYLLNRMLFPRSVRRCWR